MKASVAGELQWRLDLYRKVFDFCRQGEFSLARFLALVPDRLRLALGDSVARIRIPVAIAEEVAQTWQQLAPKPRESARLAKRSTADTRRLLRLAQLDSEIEPLALEGWLDEDAERFISALGRLYQRGLQEVGRGAGGEETAYLVHLVILESLRRVLGKNGSRMPVSQAFLLMPFLELAVEAAARAMGEPEKLSAKLGFQISATSTAFAFDVDPDEIARRPVNNYRTVIEAVQLARRVVQEPIEAIDLDRVVATLTERLVLDPKITPALAKDALLDLVRDALLLSVVQLSEERGANLDLPRAVLSSPAALQQHVFNKRRREGLIAWAQGYARGAKSIEALLRLLNGAEAVGEGDRQALGVFGKIEDRAKLAATGAMALVLDAAVESLKRDVAARIQHVPPNEQLALYRSGGCYRLSLDAQPLHQIAAERREAHLYVDFAEVTRKSALLSQRAARDALQRSLLDPLLALARRIAGDENRVRLSSLQAEGAAFRGDLASIFDLALGVRGLAAAAQSALDAAVPEVLGGSADAELEGEIERLRSRLEGVESALSRPSGDDGSIKMLRDGRALIRQELRLLEETRRDKNARVRGEPLEIGAFIGLGDRAEEIDLGPAGAVTISRAQIEAAAGARRSGWIASERRRRVAKRNVSDPFRVVVLSRQTGDEEDAPEIFNAGLALSDEALSALVQAKRSVWQIDVREHHSSPTLHARFLLEPGASRFVLARNVESKELVYIFHFAGELQPLADRAARSGVWEVLEPNTPFVRALEKALGGGAG